MVEMVMVEKETLVAEELITEGLAGERLVA